MVGAYLLNKYKKKTNITTINLGHHAGFGLIDYQEFIISCLTPNDIIIFSPEWVFYEKPDFYDTATLEDLQKNIKYLKITNKSLLVKVKSIYSNDIAFLKNQAKEQSKPYVYNCLNRNGDVISHCLIKPKILIKYHIDFSRFNIKRFRATFKYISKAKCLLIYPPTQKKIYEKYKKSFEKIQIVLSNSNLDYIDLITANVYNEIDFFDAEYHLKCDIKKKRTEKVICEILKIINSSKSN